MIGVRSPRDLLQEEYYPDDFRVLACCLLLNRTRGDQARPIAAKLFEKYPDAAAVAAADRGALTKLLEPLGFQNQRAGTLIAMARGYLDPSWRHEGELPGVGEYASACYRMLFDEDLGDDPPDDRALVDYWVWAKSGGWPDGGWADDDPLAGVVRGVVRWFEWDAASEAWTPIRGDVLRSDSALTYSHTKAVGGVETHLYLRSDGAWFAGARLNDPPRGGLCSSCGR